MAKFLKVIYSLLGLILLSLFTMVMGVTKGYLKLPASYNWLGWDITRVPSFLNPGVYYYFFWAAAIFAILTIIGILVVLFYPRTYTEIKLDKNQGTLELKKSAIEGYVKSAIQQAGLMSKPHVTAKLYKNKFKVDVAGQLDSRVGITEQVNGIKQGIESGLTDFFGLDKKVNFKVKVKDMSESEYFTGKKDRVE